MKSEEKTIKKTEVEYRGFKSAEEAKKFLEDMERDLDTFFEGTRRFFQGLGSLLDYWFAPPKQRLQDQIKHHEQEIKRLKATLIEQTEKG